MVLAGCLNHQQWGASDPFLWWNGPFFWGHSWVFRGVLPQAFKSHLSLWSCHNLWFLGDPPFEVHDFRLLNFRTVSKKCAFLVGFSVLIGLPFWVCVTVTSPPDFACNVAAAVGIGDQSRRFGSQRKIDTEQKVGGTLVQGAGGTSRENWV